MSAINRNGGVISGISYRKAAVMKEIMAKWRGESSNVAVGAAAGVMKAEIEMAASYRNGSVNVAYLKMSANQWRNIIGESNNGENQSW
jgi:hypothetical protein